MNEMDLEHQRVESLTSEEALPAIDFTKVETGLGTETTLFGTLEIDGVGIFSIFYIQKKSTKTWVLAEREILGITEKEARNAALVAVLRSFNSGQLKGWGKVQLLTRLMTNLSTMVYMCVQHNTVETSFFMKASYTQEATGSYISFTATRNGGFYRQLELAYEGYRLNVDLFNRSLPFTIPTLSPTTDAKSKAAVVANLGIKTAATLFRVMGDRLNWFKKKDYRLIDSKELFEEMMLAFLTDVQAAADSGKAVLVGLDTETTGLNMYDLSPSNPMRDAVVAIPFSWKDNTGYLICTDMFYFSNVDDDDIYPLFTKLFSRNPDFTFQQIDMDYCGKHFSFSRMNIVVAGWNVMFDERAFFSQGADVFFDEDGRQIFFNLDTDLIQGAEGQKVHGSYRISNSLKAQTRRLIGDETLELEELFGKGNEDKYRYLQDTTLALLYGGADSDYTRLCVRKGRAMLEKILYQQYRKYDMTIMYKLAKAVWQGMPIDTEAVKAQGELVYKDLERVKEFIYHYAWLANRDSLATKADRLKELLGVDNIADVEVALEQDKMFRYQFTPANHKKLLFGMLGYPIVKRSEKSGEPALDKFVLQKLMGPQRDKPVEVLKEDLMSLSDPNVKLVDKDKFNKDAFPLARVFSTYATLNKEYTSYYKPIMGNDMEGRMFYDFTMARAATRRILSPGQTMKGSLKSLVIAPPGKIFMSFDASQIEYRHMASLAYIRIKNILKQEHPDDWERRLNETSIAGIHAMMQKAEADYHIETAASMTGVKQHEVTPKVRKRYKSIGFGIPYGLGERAMCESLHSGVVNDETMKETKELLASYKVKQKEIIDLLESTRDSAFVPANISEEYRQYLGVGESHVGIVRNFVGFYRVFILENLTRPRVGRIRRQAGNCIIQGGAAELFRRMLYNFHIGCCKYGIQDKIQWVMTVHDELDAIVDADIDIVLLIKVLYENCTLRYEDHIPYYIGINFGANWLDAKADANELPVIMVQRMIEAYDAGKFSIPSDGNQSDNLLLLKRHYMCDRIEEELKAIIPNLGKGHIWTEEEAQLVDTKFENYVVRSYLDVFSKSKGSLLDRLKDWQVEREAYGFGIGFLTTRYSNGTAIDDLPMDVDFDLGIDLLNNDSEETLAAEAEGGTWFDEAAMFDQNVSTEDMIVDADAGYYFVSDALRDEEDELQENDNPTNAFDVFVSTRYMRTKVLKVQDGVYSVLTHGTKFSGDESGLNKLVRGKFSEGSDTIMIIGKKVIKVANINGTDEQLDWLDKLLVGKQEE